MGRIRSFVYRKIAEDYVRSLVNATGDNVKEAYIIGSTAKGQADPSSHDVDIALVVEDEEKIRAKAKELQQSKMRQLSEGGVTLLIHYELYSKKDVEGNPDLIHKPKKKIYQADTVYSS